MPSGPARNPSIVHAFRAILLGLCLVPQALCALPTSAKGQGTLFDPRFEEIRRASVVWDRRPGPEREVVDLVCLVPDLDAFLEAISTWDDRHFFPILIDDVETNLKFLRAFHPARVVRYSGARNDLPSPRAPLWERAVDSVGRAWASERTPGNQSPRGDTTPSSLGPVPPGVVLSTQDSPSLAGAVALAAGRFQPLLKWETPQHFADTLSSAQARSLALDLELSLAKRFPDYNHLGDDCDFVTLAGNYPYRYQGKEGLNAFDELILRRQESEQRWAYAGRLTGNPTLSVYRAMCGLFLYPNTALMLNTYKEIGSPWADYSMRAGASLLEKRVPVTQRTAQRSTLTDWHALFNPVNPFGLVVLNTSGSPTNFQLEGGGGQTADIPESVPAAVLMIHSFSSESPEDPQTIAGRWLSNGAYVFFGSLNEPFLQSFRSPTLVASFLAENLPVVSAVRKSSDELFGKPWRLVFFGDPLYRINPVGLRRPRLAKWDGVADWPAYGEFRQPSPQDNESLRLNWALKTAIFQLQSASTARRKVDLPGVLLGIARDRLERSLVPLYDALLIDSLLQNGRSAELLDRLTRVPPPDRTPSLTRHLETLQTGALQRAVTARRPQSALALWSQVIKAPGSRDFVRTFTERVGRLAESSDHLQEWRETLRESLRARLEPSNSPVTEAELKRVNDIKSTRKAR
ncbi:MAG: hypothetical protein NVSMB9_15300 [Isosphaeraceae bacterium]